MSQLFPRPRPLDLRTLLALSDARPLTETVTDVLRIIGEDPHQAAISLLCLGARLQVDEAQHAYSYAAVALLLADEVLAAAQLQPDCFYNLLLQMSSNCGDSASPHFVTWTHWLFCRPDPATRTGLAREALQVSPQSWVSAQGGPQLQLQTAQDAIAARRRLLRSRLQRLWQL